METFEPRPSRQLKLNLQFHEKEPDKKENEQDNVSLDHFFPSEDANILAAQENYNKHLYRPNTYLHKWWARRSGTTFRYILKQLVEENDKRYYYEAGGLEGKIILDPMLGGGTTLHEAIRLGASVVGFDIDPIPVLQAQSSLTHIPIKEKKAVFNSFYTSVRSTLAAFYETTCPKCKNPGEIQFILYSLRKHCSCGERLFVDRYSIRESTDGHGVGLSPGDGIPYEYAQNSLHIETDHTLIFEKQIEICPTCGEKFQEYRNIPYTDRYHPLIVFGSCPEHGSFIKKIEEKDLLQIEAAKNLAKCGCKLPIENFQIIAGPKSRDLLRKGIKSFLDVFTPRQQIYLMAAKAFIDDIDPKHRKWLSMLVSTSLEFNSLLCGYKGGDKRRPGAIRHVFSHHAYSFPYTALENNPVFSGDTSGTISLLFHDRIEAGAEWAEKPIERKPNGKGWTKIDIVGEKDWGVSVEEPEKLLYTPHSFWIRQQDSSKMPLANGSVDHVVTDPPYYDSVQYSDLAQYFRVWLRWFMPNEADWDYDMNQSAVAESEQNGGKYQQVLGAIWSECNRVLKRPLGRLVFTFHHWRPEAWAHLAISLKRANFRLVTYYIVKSENPISVHIRKLKALKHDSILVLRPVDKGETITWNRISLIDLENSYQFCAQCAELLGYCLQNDLNDDEIFTIWRKALED